MASICTLITADRIKTAMNLLNSSVQKKISKLPRYRYHLFVHSTLPQWSSLKRESILLPSLILTSVIMTTNELEILLNEHNLSKRSNYCSIPLILSQHEFDVAVVHWLQVDTDIPSQIFWSLQNLMNNLNG